MKQLTLLALGALTSSLMAASGADAAAPSPVTPAKALLVLEKKGSQLDVIDPSTLKIVGRIPVGTDPHEVIATRDGRYAYVSNYMGPHGPQHQLSVVDLMARKALAPVELGALQGPHGLDFAAGKVYFTAETAKVIGRYDPAAHAVDWVLGTGQDRTHMVWVAGNLDRIVTSNVASGTISIIEKSAAQDGAGGLNLPDWQVTNVPAGRGSEGFDVSPDGKVIWVANAQDGTATVIDVAAKRSTATIPIYVSRANRLKFTPDGRFVFISGLGAGAPNLVIIDAATRRQVKALDLGGGSAGILMDPDGTRAFVASSSGNKVVIVSLESQAVTGQIAPLMQPDGMAWAIRQ